MQAGMISMKLEGWSNTAPCGGGQLQVKDIVEIPDEGNAQFNSLIL